MRPLLMLLGGLAWAADVPGGAAPPTAGDPAFWLGYANDNLGSPRFGDGDDFRTHQTWAGWQVMPSIRLVAEHSVLTDNHPSGLGPDWAAPDPLARHWAGAARSDELSLGAAWVVRGARGEAWIGAGLRRAGRLGGEPIQDAVHGTVGIGEVDLPYAPADPAWAALAIAGVCGELAADVWTMRPQASLVGASNGSMQADLTVRLAAAGGGSSWWIAPLWQIRRGSFASPVATAVAEHEDGLWAAIGLDAGPLLLRVQRRLDDEAVIGSVGMALGRDHGVGTSSELVGELGALMASTGGRAKGPQAGLRLVLPASGWFERRLSAGLAIRRSEFDTPYRHDAHLRASEVLAAAELSFAPPRSAGLSVEPYVQALAGWMRAESSDVNGFAIAEERRLDMPSLRAAAGLRLWLADDDRGNGWCIGLTAEGDAGWTPRTLEPRYDTHGLPVDGGGGTAAHAGGPTLNASLRLAARIGW
jgi:hypothetical protein